MPNALKMPQMSKQILTIALAVTAICLVGVTSVATPSPTQHVWHIRDLFSNNQSLWTVISDQFQIDNEYIENYYVKKQIRWFLTQQPYVYELTRNSQPYIYYILQQVRKRGMPAEIALIPMIESNYDPFGYSKRGAIGLWQLMPGTASGFGLHANWWYDGRRDLVASTNAALNYLQSLHDYFHSWLLAIAAYDAGEGTVVSAIRYNRQHHQPTNFWSLPLPYETKVYIPKLLALASIIKSHSHYGIHLVSVANKPYFTTVTVKAQMTLSHLAALADTSLKALRQLNPGFRRWAMTPDHAYNILLPITKAPLFEAKLAEAGQAPTTPMSSSSQWLYHRVRSGESLSVIASQYDTTISALRRINKLRTNMIEIGEDLLIPVAEAEPMPPDQQTGPSRGDLSPQFL